MEIKLKVNNIFESIQGEGKYVGVPGLFVRLSGCNLQCEYCDSEFHTEINFEMTPKELANKITESKKDIIIWTGGEPMLQKELIKNTIDIIPHDIENHLETNGTIIDIVFFNNYFEYISFSPKDVKFAQRLYNDTTKIIECEWDIKIVTNLDNVGIDMLDVATILMPLSTFNNKIDLITKQKVWDYCVKKKKRYSPRIHFDVWGNKRGV